MYPLHDPTREVDEYAEAMRETRAVGMIVILLAVIAFTFLATVIFKVVP